MAGKRDANATDSDGFPIPQGWNPKWDWHRWLKEQFQAAYFGELMDYVATRRRDATVYPESENVFEAFRLTPLRKTRFVILGQDPYHGPGQAHGLSFSVPNGVSPPPSLRNILKEAQSDLRLSTPATGSDLSVWARQGGLLLNTVLTVEAGQAYSHQKRGWEIFTDAVINVINQRRQDVLFVLWGRPAQQKKRLIDLNRHQCLEAPHPSPLSAHRGFFGSRPFSAINRHLKSLGSQAIDWQLA